MAPADAIASVVGDWKKDEFLMKQASTGIMATCGPKEEGVTREDVCANYKVLMPIVKYLGLRPGLHDLIEAVAMFLTHARPRGKPLPSSDVIKVEAWLLRDLAYIFARAARRGHRPREDEMLELMRAADIPIPEYVPPRRSTSSAGSSRNALPDPAPPSDDGMGNMEDEDAESEDAEHDALVDPCPEDDPAPVRDAASNEHAVLSGDCSNDAEDFPGERWQHYFVKDRAHGFKCLKCSLVGRDISDLRDKDCKIPRPSGPSPSPTSTAPTSPAPTSTSALHPNALGASAAVVGEKAALDGAATRVLEEMRQLERVERDLAHELEYQALLEEEESLELAMLESELAQLELLEKQSAFETSSRGPPPASAPLPSMVVPAEAPPAASVPKAGDEVDDRKGGKRPWPKPDLMPPPKKPLLLNPTKADELPPLSPSSQDRYRSYWSRFVATPQNHHGRKATVEPTFVPAAHLPEPPVGIDNMDTLPMDIDKVHVDPLPPAPGSPAVSGEACGKPGSSDLTCNAVPSEDFPPRPEVLDSLWPLGPKEQRALLPKRKRAKKSSKEDLGEKPDPKSDDEPKPEPKRRGKKRQAGGSDEPNPEPKRRGKKVPAGGSDEPKPGPKRRGKKVPAGGSDEVKPEPKRRGKKVPAGGSDEPKPEPKRRGKKVPAGGSDETKPEPKRRGKKVQAGGSDEEPKRPGGSDMPKPESTADSSDKPKPRPKARVRKLAAPSNGAAGSTATELAAGGLAMASAVATCAAADVAETGDGVSGGGPPDAPPPDDASTTATVGDEDRKKKASRKSSAYHVAKKKALKDGKSLDEAKEIAKLAYKNTS